MHHITVPAPVTLLRIKDPTTKAPLVITFEAFVFETLATDKRTRVNLEAIDAFARVCAEVRGKVEGNLVKLRDEDWEWLSDIARSFDYAQSAVPDIVPMIRAIAAATVAVPTKPE